VHGELADAVPGARGQQQRVGQLAAVQDHEALEHRLVVLGQQVVPGLVARVGGVGHREPPAGRVAVGEDVGAAVPADVQRGLRVDVLLDDGERGSCEVGRREVGDPQVVAWSRARRCADGEPAPVARHRDPVVVVQVEAVAEDQGVRVRISAEAVQPDPPVVLLLAVGHLLGGQPPHVVVRLATRQPGDRGVAGAVDRAVHELFGLDVQHAQHRLFASALRQLVGQQRTLFAGLPAVQGGRAGGVEPHRVEQGALLARGIDGDQHGVLLPRRAPHQELTLTPPHRGADHAGTEQLADALLQPRARGPGGSCGAEQVVLAASHALVAGASASSRVR
jgi:hypothetical protein